MIRKDLHGYMVTEAVKEVEQTIALVRLEQIPQDVEFITGSGIICDTVMKTLEEYELSPHRQMGNSGVICCLIE